PRQRHGARPARGASRAHLRALLHHQEGGHRPGAGHLAADHPLPRRNDLGAEPARRGSGVSDPPPGGRKEERGGPATRGPGRLRLGRVIEMAQTVLVVDDESSLRKVLGATLRREGYNVVTAEDGEKAIARFDEGGIDVVVSDLVMPKRDGLD